MDIRFVSSLTADDENAVAPILLKAVADLLELSSISYSIQIQTSDQKTYEHVQLKIASPLASDVAYQRRVNS